MAIRTLSPKLRSTSAVLRRFTRPVNSSAAAAAVRPLNHAADVDHKFAAPPSFTSFPEGAAALQPSFASNNPVLDLGDAEKLFGNLPTAKLLKSAATLQLAAIDPLVDVGMWVMNSRLLGVPILREAILGSVRHTFYEQFCAGVDRGEMGRTVRRMWESGLRAMLVYGVEDVEDNHACDRNLQGFLDTVESAKSLPPSSASFVIVKITAICPMALLQRVSDLLRWEQRDPSFKLPWKRDTLPIFSDASPLYHTTTQPDPLTPQEEEDLQLAHQRLVKLCQSCIEANVPLTVDAEYTSVQPAIDYFTYSAAVQYNKDKNPIVFGTIQAYLKDAKERLMLTAKAAEKMGIPLGIKLVRGAYMSSEAKLAASLGCDSPVHNTIEDTHDCYNDCASFMLEKVVAGGGDSVVLATHNVDSGKLVAARARDLGIGKADQRLQFAQLYGMSEALSLGLRNAGFVVSKYMPFGPIDEVMPYLLRRAEENRGLLSTSALDRSLMMKEVKRRIKVVASMANPRRELQATAKLGNHSAFN